MLGVWLAQCKVFELVYLAKDNILGGSAMWNDPKLCFRLNRFGHEAALCYLMKKRFNFFDQFVLMCVGHWINHLNKVRERLLSLFYYCWRFIYLFTHELNDSAKQTYALIMSCTFSMYKLLSALNYVFFSMYLYTIISFLLFWVFCRRWFYF